MNDLTETLLKSYSPRLAIIAYTSTINDWHECYLESHEINEKGQLLEGKPLQYETIEGIVDVFFDQRQNRVEFGGLLPDNLLQFVILPGGKYKMMWYRPVEQRHIYFAEQLHINSGTAWIPSLVYKVDNNHLSVYALTRQSGRPKEDEEIFLSPFHNVSYEGAVCLGSAKVKKPEKKTYASVMKYWEDMFWLSEFSHLAGAKNPTKNNLSNVWKRLIDSNIKWEDIDELLPMAKTSKKGIVTTTLKELI
jgi:PRTRC genetic system protein B